MDYRRIFENLPGKFLLLEPDLTIAGASDAYLRVAFATRESLVGKPLPEQPVVVDGDPVRLAQIVSNVLNNAAKYTDEGGRIAVEVRRTDDAAEVRVSDNGAGIAPEMLTKIFDMFGRGEITSGHGKDGLGIGLALARKLTEMHGGTLEARSEGRGRGAELTMRIPLAVSASIAPPSRQEHDFVSGKRVLVVDDNEDAAEMMSLLLEQKGAEVRTAHEGKDALVILDAWSPALVLLDIGMPEMDGYEVARAIRARGGDHQPVLVAVTGWGQERDRQEARAAGFDHHMVKPADVNALQKLLAMAR